MTIVATPERGSIPSIPVSDDEEKYSRPRSVRVPDSVWWDFEKVVGKNRKAPWLTAFMRTLVRHPRLWREFIAVAEARGDSFEAALTRAFELYLADR